MHVLGYVYWQHCQSTRTIGLSRDVWIEVGEFLEALLVFVDLYLTNTVIGFICPRLISITILVLN